MGMSQSNLTRKVNSNMGFCYNPKNNTNIVPKKGVQHSDQKNPELEEHHLTVEVPVEVP